MCRFKRPIQARAAGVRHSGRESHQGVRIAVNRWQLINTLTIYGLTKVRVRRVEGCRLSRDRHRLFRSADVQRNVEVTRLVDLDLNFVLKRFLESRSLDNNLICARQEIKRIKQRSEE